jgi:signal transduction histidine kinase
LLIVRDAATNAIRHSEATKIEVEVQYLNDALRVVVRDNGCGMNPEAFRTRSDSHRGLCGMRDQAEKIGARFGIWSSLGVRTEVCVALRDIASYEEAAPRVRVSSTVERARDDGRVSRSR